MSVQATVLNLGAGVQSTTVYLMACENKLVSEGKLIIDGKAGLPYPKIGLIDYAVFADTQDEPEDVYKHLDWLESLNGPPILRRTKGRLSDHLKIGTNSTGSRFASIPAFTKADGQLAPTGKLQRQCSKEYKIEVIDRTIRREIVGLQPRQRVPKDTKIVQIFGISLDESGRGTRIYERIVLGGIKWLDIRFPLIEMFMTRELCQQWLSGRVPHEVPRSACVYCPFHSDLEWLRVKANPRDWALAVEVDEALRTPGIVLNRQLDQKLYLHRSCQPLVQIEFNSAPDPRKQQRELNFANECLGVCGV